MGAIWVTDEGIRSTRGLVSERFILSEKYANNAYNTALSYLEQFEDISTSFTWTPPAPIALDGSGISDLPVASPTAPTIVPITVGAVDFPYSPPTLDDYTIVAVDVPAFNVAMPNFLIPAVPGTSVPQFIYDAPAGSYIVIPADDIPELPPLPVLHEVMAPDEPVFSLPDFAATMPVADLTPPELIYAWNEAAYDSEIRTTLIAKIKDGILNGGTGLLPEVEQAIYDRATTRLDNELQKNELIAMSEFASRGSRLPQGALIARLDDIRFQALLARGDLTRDVLIKSADLAFQYSTFIIDKGLALEQALMEMANSIQQRAFESGKLLVEFTIREYEVRVQAFAARLEGYKTEAEIFKAMIQAEIARADLYKSTIEGRKLSLEMQALMVDLYGKQVATVEVMSKVYATKMEAAKIQAEIDGVQVERFKALVEAYKAQVDGVTAEYGLYTAQIAGESEKAKMYSYQVEGYGKMVEAYKTRNEIDISVLKAKVERTQGEVAVYNSLIGKYQADIQATVAEAEIQAKAEGLKIQAFDGEVKKFMAVVAAITDSYRSESATAISNAEIQTRYGELLGRIETAEAEIHAELIKAKALVASQLASAALSSVSAGASLGESDSYGNSDSHAHSYSYSSSTISSNSHAVSNSTHNCCPTGSA